MKRWIWQTALGLLALSLVAGSYAMAQGGKPASARVKPPTKWVKTEFYFGGNLPGGQQISKSEWSDFMDKVITPHFPKGLTVYEAYGQMKHTDGRIEKQAAWVVVVLHPKDPMIDQAIRDVTAAFRKQFNKAQVVTATMPVISAQFYAD